MIMQAISDLLSGFITLQLLFLIWSNATEAGKLVDFNLNKPLLPQWQEVIPPEWKGE